MNTLKKQPIKLSIVFRLWAIMMSLIVIALIFMWGSQLFLFEQNYINAAVNEVDIILKPIAEDLKTAELSGNPELLYNASTAVRGKTLVFDRNGNIYAAYSNSHPIAFDEVESFVGYLVGMPEFQMVFDGSSYEKILNYYDDNYYYEIGIPVKWLGQDAVLFLNHPIQEISRLQSINRRQLITLSILLTVISGIVAWVLAQQYAKPIKKIKVAVEQLAQGNLTAKPDLKLKDELGVLSDSVGDLGQALQRVDVLRKEVIANVSHELSAPLSLIIGYSELVRDFNWADEMQRNENMDLIIREARRMSNMVDDIMDYSQFQAGYIKLHKTDYNLYHIIESETGLCRPAAHDFGIKLIIQSESQEIPAALDVLKISQVLRNLLNNAINHTADGQTIYIIITNETGLKVSVNNPGAPIPEEKKTQIWERYYSSQHHGTRRQGTGIGLSIVSTILVAHGYSYGVDYQNGFNCFWFLVSENGQ